MKDENKTYENEINVNFKQLEFDFNDKGPNDLEQQLLNKDKIISKLYQKITDLMAINDSHKFILTNQIETNKNLDKEIMKLKQEIKDIYYVR